MMPRKENGEDMPRKKGGGKVTDVRKVKGGREGEEGREMKEGKGRKDGRTEGR